MGKFLTKLDYSPARSDDNSWNGRDYRLDSPLIYEANDGKIYTIPKDFVTDGASIPRFFWRIYLPYGKYIEAAVLHDYIYRTPTIPLTRKQADKLLEEAMEWCQVNAFDRKVIYTGVRIGGWFAYKKRNE